MNTKLKATIITLSTLVIAATIISTAVLTSNRDELPVSPSSSESETTELKSESEITTTASVSSAAEPVETIEQVPETTTVQTTTSATESSEQNKSEETISESGAPINTTIESIEDNSVPVDTTVHTATTNKPVEEPVESKPEVTTAVTTTQSPTPVQTTTVATTISTPATTITNPSEPKPYSTYGLKIGDFTDQGYEVIGVTPDEGIPYIAIDEQWETQQKVVVGYTSWGAPVYNTDMTAWHKAHDAKNQQAVEDFLAHGGTIG